MILFKKRYALEQLVKHQQSTLENQQHKLEEMAVDILTAKADATTTYRGNTYLTYPDAVAEIHKKYTGVAEWGVWAGNIIDVRAAFVVGKGLRVVKVVKEADKELEFAEKFIKDNNLMLSMPLIYAVEGEVEGKFLANLFIEDEIIKVRYVPWTATGYTVKADDRDYLRYIEASYKPDTGKVVKYSEGEFVYRKWGGRVYNVNEATPKLWRSLTQIDEVDNAYRDQREINRLLAAPTPYIKCETTDEAEWTLTQVRNINMKAKKFLVGTGDLKYVTIPGDTGKPLTDEIVTKLKSISGNTGVPVHFMGLPELMSNRATADNLMELIWASTVKDRQIWQSAYTEILRKAIDMWNIKTGKTPLDPMNVEIQIPEISSAEWDMISTTWLPLYMNHAITLELLLSKIPDIDIEAERKRKEDEDEKAALEFEKRKGEIEDNLNGDEDE